MNIWFRARKAFTKRATVHRPGQSETRARAKITPREKGEKFLIRCWFKCRGASTSAGLGTTTQPRRGQVPATKSLWVTFEARCRNVNEASLLYIDLSGQWNSQSRSKRCVLGRLERDEKKKRAREGEGERDDKRVPPSPSSHPSPRARDFSIKAVRIQVTAWFVVIFCINTTSEISKLLYVIRNLRQFSNITSGNYAKYHVQIMLLFVYATTSKRFVIFTCRYFKLSWNTTALSQSNCRNFSCSSIIMGKPSGNLRRGL